MTTKLNDIKKYNGLDHWFQPWVVGKSKVGCNLPVEKHWTRPFLLKNFFIIIFYNILYIN